MSSAEHEFGGPWTEIKLDAVSEYLKFFTGALRNKFELWYVDAFAGSGERTTTRTIGGLLEGVPMSEEKVQLEGSAKRALAVQPPFKHLVFIEQNAKRFAALKRLTTEHANREISIRRDDGNDALREIFGGAPWSQQRGGRGPHRAVVFLDPYAMAVKWDTLRALADTGALDVWYLFPLNAVVRQLAKDFSVVDAAKQASLDEIFGTPNWRTELYSTHIQTTLFDNDPVEITRRSADQRKIEAYAKVRLKTLFPYVSDPLPLLTPGGAQLFSLFCTSANASPAARALVAKGVSYVLTKYG
jgi:three-Cys-motif partner protein